ncbi:MAG: Brp/Blh family beta-carotene 15,15'-dioxygenase [Pseudomonadota bacterium]
MISSLACSALWFVMGSGGGTHSLFIAMMGGIILATGLPHGALDLAISQQMPLWQGGWGRLWFHVVYICIAFVTILAFSFLPTLALTLFLLISIFHFADDWREKLSLPLRISAAALLIYVPSIAHPAEVMAIFSAITEQSMERAEAPPMIGMVSVWILSGIVGASFLMDRSTGVEILALVIAAIFLPPLIFFAVYFGGLHSVRHFHRFQALLSSMRHFRTILIYSLGAVLLTWMLIMLTSYETIERGLLDENIFRFVFIGLAALTVPHVLLLEMLKQRDQYPEVVDTNDMKGEERTAKTYVIKWSALKTNLTVIYSSFWRK